MRGRVGEGSIEDAEWCTACRNGETIRHNVRQNEKRKKKWGEVLIHNYNIVCCGWLQNKGKK